MDQYEKNSVDAVLRVLTLVIFADRLRRSEETLAARVKMADLAVFTEERFAGSRDVLETLIAAHVDEVDKAIDDSDFHTFVEEALRRIDDPMLIPMVLDARHAVAHADAEMHPAEQDLILRAESLWGFDGC